MLHFIAAFAVLVLLAIAGLLTITMWDGGPQNLKNMDRRDWIDFAIIALVAGGVGVVLHTLLNLCLGGL